MPDAQPGAVRMRVRRLWAGAAKAIRAFTWIVLVIWVGWPVLESAELRSLPEHEVQALYVYNFTKYVDWPAHAFSSAEAPFVIALVGPGQTEQDLHDITRGKSVGGRRIVIRPVTGDNDLATCHTLIITA